MHHPRVHRRRSRPQRCIPAAKSDPCGGYDHQPAWVAPVAHLLLPGEVASMQVDAYGWRWEPSDVTYDRRLLLLGGPIGMAVSGVASIVANRGARRRAERDAAPAWRALGTLIVIATDLRLLVWHQDAWNSVWYSAITRIGLNLAESHVELSFAADPPYRLQGGQARSLYERVQASRSDGLQ